MRGDRARRRESAVEEAAVAERLAEMGTAGRAPVPPPRPAGPDCQTSFAPASGHVSPRSISRANPSTNEGQRLVSTQSACAAAGATSTIVDSWTVRI